MKRRGQRCEPAPRPGRRARKTSWRRLAAAATVVLMAVSLSACNNGGPLVNNVQPVIVDAGPTVGGQPLGDADVLFTTVTICVPGTATCQTIDHVAVDTGATGLRIPASQLTLTLPGSTDAKGQPIGNCIQYADNTYQWGPVVKADIQMAGEVASSVPLQVAGPSNFPAVPSDCSAGGTPAQTVSDLGANAILGVGIFRQDCGADCASSSPPPVYYSCPSSGCSITSVSLAEQLQNPVWMFPQDNNGLLIVLPQIAASGVVSVSGSMIFGIGTQSNNTLSGAQAQATDIFGNFTTTFNGTAYSGSFIDSGSNGLYFLSSRTAGLPNCPSSQAAGFYCPASEMKLTAINSGPNPNGSAIPVSANVAFSIANAVTLLSSPNNAFNNLGGSNPGAFDWGLPFFFGRTVFIGIEGQSSDAGVGPYWAY
jgi:Protein of unknown function (DUF3443)